MRKIAVLSVAILLTACQNPDITAYHHSAAHPYKVTESSVRLKLNQIADASLYDAVASFAAERPNEGSSFIVSAPAEMANELRSVLINAGVDARDIRLVPDGEGEIVRIDRLARAENCSQPIGVMSQKSYLTTIDDGWGRDNSNSQMIGCSIRRNIVEMVDDPRSLVGPVKSEGRDGKRAATIHETWTQGKDPSSKIKLEGGTTTDSVLAGDGK